MERLCPNGYRTWKTAGQRCLLVALLLVTSTLLVACGDGPTSGNTADEMFRAVITKPIPPDVSDLQGVGDTWQGYQLFLRFHATDTFMGQVLTGYESVACDTVLDRLALPTAQYDQFLPSWSPESVADPDCYETSGTVQNEWTHAGEHFLLVDTATGMVYFVGVGA